MKQVVIVKAGQRGQLSAERGDYDNLVESLKDRFGGVRNSRGEPMVQARVVDHEVAASPMSKGDILVFVSLNMLAKAQEIQKRNPWLRVVVLTGLLPEGEVTIVDKNWLHSPVIDCLASDSF